MEEESATVSQIKEGNQLKLYETVMGMVRERPEDAVQIIRTWILEIDTDLDTDADTMPEKKKGPNYTGRQKAAIFLVAIGIEISVEIFKCLKDDELETLTFEIARLKTIWPDQKGIVLQEFHEIMTANQFVSIGGFDFARELLEKSLGSQKAIEIINNLISSLNVRPIDFIRRLDPDFLINSIQSEHPQIIALVLANIEPDIASVVLDNLHSKIQSEVARRIATMDNPDPEALREIGRVLERKFSTSSEEDYIATGGVESIAAILTKVNRSTEKMIIETLEDEDPVLVEKIKKMMFVFEDIFNLDDYSIQKVIHELDPQELAKALKSVDTAIQEKIFRNMSKSVAEILREDMENMGPIRLKDMEESQQNIVSIIRHLEDTGEIVITRIGKDDLVTMDPSEFKYTWDSILSKLKNNEKDLLLNETEHKTLVTALKQTPRDVFRDLTKSWGFFKRLKLRLDIHKLKDWSEKDVFVAQDKIKSIIKKSIFSESTKKSADDMEVKITESIIEK